MRLDAPARPRRGIGVVVDVHFAIARKCNKMPLSRAQFKTSSAATAATAIRKTVTHSPKSGRPVCQACHHGEMPRTGAHPCYWPHSLQPKTLARLISLPRGRWRGRGWAAPVLGSAERPAACTRRLLKRAGGNLVFDACCPVPNPLIPRAERGNERVAHYPVCRQWHRRPRRSEVVPLRVDVVLHEPDASHLSLCWAAPMSECRYHIPNTHATTFVHRKQQPLASVPTAVSPEPTNTAPPPRRQR